MGMAFKNTAANAVAVGGENGRLLRNIEIGAEEVKRITELTRDCKLGWVLDVGGCKAAAYATVQKGKVNAGGPGEARAKGVISLEFEYYQQEGTRWKRLNITVNSGGKSQTFQVDGERAAAELRDAVDELHDVLYSSGT